MDCTLVFKEEHRTDNEIEFSILDNQPGIRIVIDNPWAGERALGERTDIDLNAEQVKELVLFLVVNGLG